MNPEEAAHRLERLEAGLAHLERLADQLNEALVDQGRQMARLHKRLEQLGETVQARDDPAGPPAQERPPHYGR